VLRGENPVGVGSVNRLVKSEFEQRMHTLALRASGLYGMLGSRAAHAVNGGRWTYGYLKTRASTIGAGTAEIQRNTIAESVLGLPSHRGEGVRTASVRPGAPLVVADQNESELRGSWPRLSTRASISRRCWIRNALPKKGIRLCARRWSNSAFPVWRSTSRSVVPAAFAVPLDDAGWVTTGARLPHWEGASLSGEVPLVVGAPDAEVLLTLASSGSGEVLVAVDQAGTGITIEPEQPLDLTATVGSVTFVGATGDVLADGEHLRRAVESARRRALLTVAADSIGVAAAALGMAVAWAGEREQFGRKIGTFQAVSHRCADMLVAIEGARSQVLAAAEADEPGEVDCMLAAAAAFDAAVFAAERSIQIHGGIGFTWEHSAHLLLRRARANAVAVGRPEMLRDRAAVALLAGRTRLKSTADLRRIREMKRTATRSRRPRWWLRWRAA
jgi:acyl-CoA dehydrogenase